MAARLVGLSTSNPDGVRALREALGAEAEALTDATLVSWLEAGKADAARAAAMWRSSGATLEALGTPTVRDVAQFMRAPSPERRYPDGCAVLLEDLRGGVARDKLGRPVVAMIGMQHGSKEEMQRQLAYMMMRAAKYALPGQPPGAICTVMDIVPQEKGAPATFRFPDRDVRSLFELQSRCFPGALFATTHFCGLPRLVAWSFRLVKPFMAKQVYDAMVLKPSFAHLPRSLGAEAMLPRWGGELAFDIDDYVEWLAAEERVPTSELCGRGCGRAYDAKAAAAAAAAALAESLASGASITARGLVEGTPTPRMVGEVSKRGSGSGVFSTTRWKVKLLAVGPLGLVYFDGLTIDDANSAARIVQLDESAHAERRPAEAGTIARVKSSGPAAQFALMAGTREYLFGVDDEAVADAWVSAIRAQVDEARDAQLAAAGAQLEIKAS